MPFKYNISTNTFEDPEREIKVSQLPSGGGPGRYSGQLFTPNWNVKFTVHRFDSFEEGEQDRSSDRANVTLVIRVAQVEGDGRDAVNAVKIVEEAARAREAIIFRTSPDRVVTNLPKG